MTANKIFKGLLPIGALAMLPSSAFAANLQSDDFVGISFWLISMALMAATVFSMGNTKRRWQVENFSSCIRLSDFHRCSSLLLYARRMDYYR